MQTLETLELVIRLFGQKVRRKASHTVSFKSGMALLSRMQTLETLELVIRLFGQKVQRKASHTVNFVSRLECLMKLIVLVKGVLGRFSREEWRLGRLLRSNN